MQATWVVVADRNCATVFSVPRGLARLRQLAELHYSPMPVNGDAGEPCGGDIQASEPVPDCVERQAAAYSEYRSLRSRYGRWSSGHESLKPAWTCVSTS